MIEMGGLYQQSESGRRGSAVVAAQDSVRSSLTVSRDNKLPSSGERQFRGPVTMCFIASASALTGLKPGVVITPAKNQRP